MNEKKLINYINKHVKKDIHIMEVSGLHTHEIKKNQLERVLTSKIHFISGPGCPISLTSSSFIDIAIELVKQGKIIVTTSDIVKVKGSKASLLDMISSGGKVKIVYSPLDLFSLIEKNKHEEFVFVGIGYESTAPVLASIIKTVKKLRMDHISFLISIKRMNSIIKYVLDNNKDVHGLIVPSQIASITGSDYFTFITQDYNISCSVSGFKTLDLLSSIFFLIKHIKKPQFINLYPRLVPKKSNKKASHLINQVFKISDDNWQGVGSIKNSGYQLIEKYDHYNAQVKYNLSTIKEKPKELPVFCHDVIFGRKKPKDCPFFKVKCDPYHPLGPCMATHEGTCLIHYKYNREEK